jgi:hypothetical protein
LLGLRRWWSYGDPARLRDVRAGSAVLLRYASSGVLESERSMHEGRVMATSPTAQARSLNRGLRWAAAIACMALAVALWASDRVTLQGQRILYLGSCVHGDWEGERCTGTLVPAAAWVFESSKRRHEVVHWTRGSDAPSVTYRGCEVRDRDNWMCPADPNGSHASAVEMRSGRIVGGLPGVSTPIRAIPKWKWWLARTRAAFARVSG